MIWLKGLLAGYLISILIPNAMSKVKRAVVKNDDKPVADQKNMETGIVNIVSKFRYVPTASNPVEVVLYERIGEDVANEASWKQLGTPVATTDDFGNAISAEYYFHQEQNAKLRLFEQGAALSAVGGSYLAETDEFQISEVVRDTLYMQFVHKPQAGGNIPDILMKSNEKDAGSRKESSDQSTFIDYIKGGLELDFPIAIDFTGSNGNPNHADPKRAKKSLHYLDSDKSNEYQLVMEMTGQVLTVYDNDNKFPVYGFGAEISGKTVFDFALNGNDNEPDVEGIDNVLEEYKKFVKRKDIQLSGPTNFAPILRKIKTKAEEIHKQKTADSYIVLLIITDGVITDMKSTVEVIVSAAHLPLSIVIVGVGDPMYYPDRPTKKPEDSSIFENMVTLDGDGDNRLTDHKNNVAVRDIVQFVIFQDPVFQKNPKRLLAEFMFEIPDQVVSYFESRNPPIKAKPAIEIIDFDKWIAAHEDITT